jgi:hypothetical protein
MSDWRRNKYFDNGKSAYGGRLKVVFYSAVKHASDVNQSFSVLIHGPCVDLNEREPCELIR